MLSTWPEVQYQFEKGMSNKKIEENVKAENFGINFTIYLHCYLCLKHKVQKK